MLYSPFSDSMVDWLSRDRVTAVLAANVQFESGTAYVHSGTGTLVLGGYVYYGMGTMGPSMMWAKPTQRVRRS